MGLPLRPDGLAPSLASHILDQCLARGLACLQSCDWVGAIAAYRQVLASSPGHIDARHFLGIACTNAGELDEAIGCFDAVLALDPNWSAAWTNRGNVHFARQDFEAAEKDYRRAVESDPRNANAWLNLGVMARKNGKLEEATRAYERALLAEPGFARARDQLALTLTERASESASPEDLSWFVERYPDHDGARLARARLWLTLGKSASAQLDLEQILNRCPTDAEAWMELARCHRVLGDEAAAERALDHAELLGLIPVPERMLRARAVERVPLSESGIQVADLTVVMPCRDSELYLPRFFALAEALEQTYSCDFHYLFVENGSRDATRALIEGFLMGRDGALCTPADPAELDRLPRTARLAAVRNFSAQEARRFPGSWLLLVDTDIYFHPRILEILFAHHPTAARIGMLCGYGIDVAPASAAATWTTQHHYYDTFAFVSERGTSYYPQCIFQGCRLCAERIPQVERTALAGLVKVQSAFGGLALLRQDVLTDQRIRWEAISAYGRLWCEHIAFCGRLRQFTDYSIAIATDAPVLWDPTVHGRL